MAPEPDPGKVPQHVELETPAGLLYALIEDWHEHPDSPLPHRKVLTLQPANGSGEPGGQACTPQRHELHAPEVDRLVQRHPQLSDLVSDARAFQPAPAAVPTVTDLLDEVRQLRAELGQRSAPAGRQSKASA